MSFAKINDSLMERALYVLKCKDDYYYIGESSVKFSERYQLTSLDIRIKQQFGEQIGRCVQSNWCRLHNPIEVVEIIKIGLKTYHEAEILENALTKIYVQKYGPDKVRGGISCLSDDNKQSLDSSTKQTILDNTTIK